MLEFVGNIIGGGFDLVENIVGGAAQGVQSFTSGFFPTAQKQTPITISQQAPVVNTGLSYRPTSAEMPSAIESAAAAARNWMDSSWEGQFGPSEVMQQTIGEPNWGSIVMDPIEKLWGAAGEIGAQISDQLPDILMRKWGLLPEAQPQNTQGDVTYHVYPDPNLPQPATVPAAQAGQPKGTYDIGFLTDWLKIPAATIPTPTAAQAKQIAGISAKTIALIGVGALLFWGLKKL